MNNEDEILKQLKLLNNKVERILIALTNCDGLVKVDNAVNCLCGENLEGLTEKETYIKYRRLHDKMQIATGYMTIKNVNKVIRENTDYTMYNTTREGKFVRAWKI